VHAEVAGGIRKFVDSLPGLTEANANNLGKYIPVAEPEVRTYNGIEADYYEIAVVQYEEKFPLRSSSNSFTWLCSGFYRCGSW
jgi:hypothetical protein